MDLEVGGCDVNPCVCLPVGASLSPPLSLLRWCQGLPPQSAPTLTQDRNTGTAQARGRGTADIWPEWMDHGVGVLGVT